MDPALIWIFSGLIIGKSYRIQSIHMLGNFAKRQKTPRGFSIWSL